MSKELILVILSLVLLAGCGAEEKEEVKTVQKKPFPTEDFELRAYVDESLQKLGRTNPEKAVEVAYKSCYDGKIVDCYFGAEIASVLNTQVYNTRSHRLHKEGCDKGMMLSCWRLGGYYHTGVGGIRKDKNEALRLFDKACAGDIRSACFDAEQLRKY